jgi:hypothetical protein
MATSSPTSSREGWASHPHYPAQVLLLGSHDNFRNISRRLVQEARAGRDLRWVADLYHRWISAMRSHEAYEEQKLYRYLERRWDQSFAACEEGHQELHARDAEVRAAVRAMDLAQTPPDPALCERLAAALQAHDDALVRHLQVEEDLVIPLLLDLCPWEFTRYTNHSLSTLLQDLAASS